MAVMSPSTHTVTRDGIMNVAEVNSGASMPTSRVDVPSSKQAMKKQ